MNSRLIIRLVVCLFYLFLQSNSEIVCEESNNRIKSLPLFFKSEIPCMYSNHIPIKTKLNQNEEIFSILVKSTGSLKDPLLIWLNGEYSSMLGLFSDIGPIKLTSKYGNPVGIIQKSFIDFTNILFVDFPLGSGFSITHNIKSIPSDLNEISQQFYSFIDNFLDIFKEFQGRDIILAGENFCGKFIPSIAQFILSNNEKVLSKKTLGRVINIKKIFIGNGVYDTKFHLQSRKKLLNALNIISKEDEINYEYITNKCLFNLMNNKTESHSVCEAQMSFIQKIAGFLNKHEISRSEDYFIKDEELINVYLNRKDVIDALHLDNIPLNFNVKNKSLDMIIGPNIMVQSSKKSLENLLNHFKIDIILYSGMFDLVNGPSGLENFLNDLTIDSKYATEREIFSLETKTGLEQVGYLKRFSPNLLFLNIKRAGYFITRTKKSISYFLYENLIKGNIDDFNLCRENSKCQNYDDKCQILKKCNKNGNCIQGKCHCFENFYGADCSIPVNHIQTGELELRSKEQLIFKFKENYDYYIEFESDHYRDLHVRLVSEKNIETDDEDIVFVLKSKYNKNIIYLHKNILMGKLLQVRNSNFHNFSFKMNTFATNYRRNVWGPGGSGFIITFIVLATGIFLFYYIYNLQRRANFYHKNFFVITSEIDMIPADNPKVNKEIDMVVYKEHKILERDI